MLVRPLELTCTRASAWRRGKLGLHFTRLMLFSTRQTRSLPSAVNIDRCNSLRSPHTVAACFKHCCTRHSLSLHRPPCGCSRMPVRPWMVRSRLDLLLLLSFYPTDSPGRRLWLRPGKRYLFGRTRAERTYLSSFPVPSPRSLTDRHSWPTRHLRQDHLTQTPHDRGRLRTRRRRYQH